MSALLRLLGVVFQRADDFQDAPDIADLPVGLAELVELIQLGIVVAFQATLLHDQRRGIAEDPAPARVFSIRSNARDLFPASR